MARTKRPITLCIDIGGAGIKALTIDEDGEPTCERVRIETPRPATPDSILHVVEAIVRQMPPYDRVSVGFPGVVVDGAVKTAPNLDPAWAGHALAESIERITGHPVRAANDAGVQGLGVIEGKGTELVLTLGTGVGFALYIDGRYVPNVEMAHHPFRKGRTYEQYVGEKARKRIGRKKWNRRVRRVVEQLEPIFNYRVLYVGGGNAKRIDFKPPPNVKVVDNIAGLLGGVRLWEKDA